MIACGNILKYGNNIDTDVIIPARYLNTSDSKLLAVHCMEDLDPQFSFRDKNTKIMVAGENFGCGSSREHAPIAIKESGIECVIAGSFARIFFRNAINIGMPILECSEFVENCDAGDLVEIDFDSGKIFNKTKGESYSVKPFPPFLQNIIKNGGLMLSANTMEG